MDFKKFITDLAAIYRMPTARTPVGPIVDVDAVHEVGRKAGHEAVTRRMPPPLLSYHGSVLSSPQDKCQHSHGNKRRDDGNGYDISDRPAGFPDCPVCKLLSLVAGH